MNMYKHIYHTMDLCNAETASTLLQIAVMYDVTLFIIQCREASLLACRMISHVLDKMIDRSAHHGHVVDTPNQPRESNPSMNLTRHS